ncbi:MAG: TetR/AcrR family transcriptional regulator [Clostridiaceae bacterium]
MKYIQVDNNISSKKKEKKLAKENNLYNAGYDLFLTKGLQKTAIDDIVKKAGVAKGTFYLYFKDKYDLLHKIIINKSCEILKDALKASETLSTDDFIEMVIFIANYIIEYFKNNVLLLKIINKNISWGLFKRAIETQEEREEVKIAIDSFIDYAKKYNQNVEEIEKTIYIIVELIGSVSYNSIIYEEPDNIDNMKPILFTCIKKILTQ